MDDKSPKGGRVYAPAATETPAVEEEKEEEVTGEISPISVSFRPLSEVKDDTVDYVVIYPFTENAVESLLKDLYSYFQNYNTDAVDYLIRTDKYRYISQQLEGTDNYYYYGEEDKDGTPNGMGVAVYSDNRWYYGSFSDGVRSGEGTWIQIFVKNGTYSKANNGITTHTYKGSWANDLPDGSGQEHIDADLKYQKHRITTNVIGTFSRGMYNGDEYIITVTPDGDTQEWQGTADNGIWNLAAKDFTLNERNEVPVCTSTTDSQSYIWISKSVNKNQGITGLVK